MKRIDGHAAWVSSRVIEEAGDLPSSIEGGEIIRDKDGYPTGIGWRDYISTFLILC